MEPLPEKLSRFGNMCAAINYGGTDSASKLDETDVVYQKIYSNIINTVNKCIDFLQNGEVSFSQPKNRNECGVDLNQGNAPVGPYMYELYAIIIHSGNALGGHYYSYIKDLKTNQWLCFDDESVSVVRINIK